MNDLAATASCPDRIHRLSTRREAVMSVLAILFLVLTALALRYFERDPQDLAMGRLTRWLIVALWLLISLESVAGYWRCGGYSWRSTGRLLLICALPPYRLSVSSFPGGRCIWLPVMGWQIAEHNCFARLDRAFSIPMLFIALMILPILAVEIFWAEYVVLYPALALILDLGTAAIWFAFATELIVMSAIADKKLAYLVHHWLNLLIVLLPFLSCLRGLQVTRLLRLGKLSKGLKIYRLRGLSLRAWKGVVTLELLDRVRHRSHEARVQQLRRRAAEKERDLEHLRARIRDLEAVQSAKNLDTSSSGNGASPGS